MSTITLKNPPEARELSAMEAAAKGEIPPALWRSYRRARGAHPERVPSYAAGLALAEHGITTERGRWERVLGNKEVEQGLRPSRHEREADAEADAAAAQAARAAVEDGSIEAVEADARARVGTLREQVENMAVEALTDSAVAAEQKSALSELAEAELALENVARARRVTSRRETEAGEQAELEARASAERAAAELEPGIAKRKTEIDRLLDLAAVETRGLADMQQSYNARRAAAGVDPFNLKATAFRPAEIRERRGVPLRGNWRLSRSWP